MFNKNRKKLLVDKRVQGVLIRQLIYHWILAGMVMFLYLLIMQVFSTPERMTLVEHLGAIWRRYGILLVAVIAVFPVFVYDSIKLSNRFVGPMVSFRNRLEKLARGEAITALNFRKKDFWHDLSGDLNAIARRMRLFEEGPASEKDQVAAS